MKQYLLITFFFILSCKNELDFNSEKLIKDYKAETLNYFYETVFYQDGLNEKVEILTKWRRNIRLSLHGDYTIEEVSFVKEVIKQINALNISVKIELTKLVKNSNCILFFGDRLSFKNRYNYQVNKETEGIAITKSNGGEIYKGYIGIFKDSNLIQKKTVILEEIVQVLGIQGDSFSFRNSLFYEAKNKNTSFSSIPDIDKKIIKLLYNEDLYFGLKREVFENKLDKVLYKVNVNKTINYFLKNKINVKDLNFIKNYCFVNNRFFRFSNKIPITVKGEYKKEDELLIKFVVKKLNKEFKKLQINFNLSESFSDGIFVSFDESKAKNGQTAIKVYDREAMYPKRWKSKVVFNFEKRMSDDEKVNSMKKAIINSLGPFWYDKSILNFRFEILDLIYNKHIPDGISKQDFIDIIEMYKSTLNKKRQ
ncbi:DUF2927 domain-containing protein [uncultured Tenacibaculum sp.]|uniref:DUF2927 domain-containing protein n=1 Tax=uncultured Tenacibaculum sp. TaxID=174713 RepID=UPI0026097972|nr:DUF2927 domain-containing protein [uncultured Tenacibaculum sp.]